MASANRSNAFSALTLVSTRPVAAGPVDDDLPDHDAATTDAVFSRPMPDWTDRSSVAAFAADGAELLGNDPEQARATAPGGRASRVADELGPARQSIGDSCTHNRLEMNREDSDDDRQ